MKRFAVFDIDGTLFRGGLYREIALAVMKAGVIDQDLVDKAHRKRNQWKARQHPDSYDHYEEALVEALNGSLKNIPPKLFDQLVSEIVDHQLEHIYTFTRAELDRLKEAGYFLIAISGSPEELVEPFAKKYQFDAWIGQKYIRNGDKFTGEAIKTHTSKGALLQDIVTKYDLTSEESYAYGDSIGDRELLESVDNPIAFNPTIELLELAKTNGWPIVIERKSIFYRLESRPKDYQLVASGKIAKS